MQITVTPGKVRRTLEALGRVTTKQMILEDTLTPEEAEALADLYPEWSGDGVAVEADAIYRYQGKLYRCVQAHTTQADWAPDTAASLWTQVAAAGVVPEWVQPTGAQDAYNTGDRVTHDNPNDGGAQWIYESAIDANTTEPGRDGTFDRYWTPIEAV